MQREVYFEGPHELYGGMKMARLAIGSLHAEAGLGFYLLILVARITLDPPRQGWVKVQDIRGALLAGGPSGQRILSALRWREPFVRTVHEGERTAEDWIDLVAELDRSRMEAVEDLRAGGDLNLAARVQLLVQTEKELFWTRSLEEAVYRVPQSEWVRILEQAGYDRRLLLEIPAPNPEEFPELARAAGLLREAQEALFRGDYRKAVVGSRAALEALTEVLKDRGQLGWKAFERELDKEGRFRLARAALFHLCSLAAHEGEKPTDWLREDAAAILAMVGAVLRREGRRLQEERRGP
jgi:hypothetical protein